MRVPGIRQPLVQVGEPASHRGDPQFRRQVQHRPDQFGGAVWLVFEQAGDARADPGLGPCRGDQLRARVPCRAGVGGGTQRAVRVAGVQRDGQPEDRYPILGERPGGRCYLDRGLQGGALLRAPHRGSGPGDVSGQCVGIGLIPGELNRHRACRAALQSPAGQVARERILVTPTGVFGKHIPRGCLDGTSLAQVQEGGVAVVIGLLAVAQVAEEQAGVSQDLAIQPEQLALMPVSQPATDELLLDLVLQLANVRQQFCGRGQRVRLRENRRGAGDALDLLVTGDAGGKPLGQARRVFRCPALDGGSFLATIALGQEPAELRPSQLRSPLQCGVQELLCPLAGHDAGRGPPADHAANRHAEVLGELLIRHAQRFAQGVGMPARPGRD